MLAEQQPNDIADPFRELFDPPLGSVRYRVYYGGRGGAKSWSIARAALTHGVNRPLRVLCVREYQTSIRDSVHRLLSDQIVAMGLEKVYTVEKSRIYSEATKTEFLFFGLKRDPHTIKSLEGVDLCWVEEAHAISSSSLELLIPTIRKEGSEIWFSFNPDQESDPVYSRFVKDPPKSAIVRKVGWSDNPWISKALLDEREDMLRRDPEAEAHVWGGEPWTRSDAQVLAGRYVVEEFTPDDSFGSPLYGADWGFARDPTVLLRFYVKDSRGYIEYDERGIGWNADETARRFRRVPGSEDHTIRADCARPETIAEIKRRGFRIVGARKWAGSVEDGVEFLRGFEWVIHPRCEGFIQEARLWRYKTDQRTGDVLPKLIDANNHGPDALRYGLEPMIRKRKSRKIRVV